MNRLLIEFETYCQTPGVNSGKARSYSNSIRYLCDFLNAKNIDEEVVLKFKSIEYYLSTPDSPFYKDMLIFLNERGQSSYLRKRFIKASLNHFFDFWETLKYLS